MGAASSRELAVILLAAGQGTRMRSGKAKVLHELAGLPLLAYPLAAVETLAPDRLLVVVGRDAEQIQEAFAGRCEFVLQAEQRGTGHAVLQALPALEGFQGDVLILYGDHPLFRGSSLGRMAELKERERADLVLISADLALPGRIVRDAHGRVERIVETTDATPEELEIREGNTGVYLLDRELLAKALSHVDDQNAQAEIYVTDIVQHCVSQGLRVEALKLEDADEARAVNTRAELAVAAAHLRARNAARWMEAGVTLEDPSATYIDTDVEIGADTIIEPGCAIRGGTRIGERVHVKAHTTIEASRIDDDVVIGPAAHLRPGTHLHAGVRIGNFVEVKNSELGPGVKADHLAYIGDADVGEGATFGCGAITVNYDWNSKSRTTVGPGANIGCNVNLIAPVSVGRDAAVAAGTTVTKDVPPGALGVAREKQRNVEGWREKRNRKIRKEEG